MDRTIHELEIAVKDAMDYVQNHPGCDAVDAAYAAVAQPGSRVGVEFGGNRWPELLSAVHEAMENGVPDQS